MNRSLAAWLLVFGWAPMLVGVFLRRLSPRSPSPSEAGLESEAGIAGRRRTAPSEARRSTAPAGGRSATQPLPGRDRSEGPRRRGPLGAEGRGDRRRDAILLLLTWCACAAQTIAALLSMRQHSDPVRSACGVALFLSGMSFWTWGRTALGEGYAQIGLPPRRLVETGPYRIVQHPLYLGTAAGCLGQAVAGGTWPGFAVWAALLLVLAARARREERHLLTAFGPAWSAYASGTARALPFLF